MILIFHGLVINSYILHFGDNEPPPDYPTTFAIKRQLNKNPTSIPTPKAQKAKITPSLRHQTSNTKIYFPRIKFVRLFIKEHSVTARTLTCQWASTKENTTSRCLFPYSRSQMQRQLLNLSHNQLLPNPF